MTELKATGGSIHLSQEQFRRLIQTPLRTRRERLGLTHQDVAERSGLSLSASSVITGYGVRSEVGIYVSTLVKVVDALEYPVCKETFQVILSIGGSDLPGAIDRAKASLKPWRAEKATATLARPTTSDHPDPVPVPKVVTSPGATLTTDQAQKLFTALLPNADPVELVASLRARGVLDEVCIRHAEEQGWVVVR